MFICVCVCVWVCLYLRYNDNNNIFSRKGHVKIFPFLFILRTYLTTLNMQLLLLFRLFRISSYPQPPLIISRCRRLSQQCIYVKKIREIHLDLYTCTSSGDDTYIIIIIITIRQQRREPVSNKK